MAANTSTKVAALTGAAKDDLATVSEGTGSYVVDVLANDPGSAALYSLAQGVAASSAQFPLVSSATLASGATISIVSGKIVYANTNAQALAQGEVWTDTFTYTIRMANGALSTATARVTITGENDAATISGDTTGQLSEDDASVQGTLSVSDVDHGENVFAADVASQTTVGSFSFDRGHWTYAPGAAAQALHAGETATETLTVKSLDGTDSKTVTVTVVGVNDAATISGETSGSVTEDSAQQTAGGVLTVTDVDHGQNVFASVSPNALIGAYGTFTFDADSGAWGYTLNNAAAQSLGSADTAYDVLAVTSLDGTASEEIRVAIHGVDEPVVVPPAPTTPPASNPPANPSVQFVVNQGTDVTNQRVILNGFDANDTLKYTSQFMLKSYAATDYDHNGTMDTAILFSYQQNKNSAPFDVEVILVGYTGLNAAQLVT